MTDYHFKKFLDQVTPLENFDDEIPPEAPNYADLVYWAATPDQKLNNFSYLMIRLRLIKKEIL